MATVPSQVLEYLDIAFPQAKEQSEFTLGGRDAPALAHLLRLLDAMPQDLVSLEGQALASWGESIETLRIAVDAWRGGNSNHVIDKLDRYGNVNPITLLREHLAALSDIPVPESVDYTRAKELEQKFRILFSARQAGIDFAVWTGPHELGLPVTVLFVDIDEFKALNARHSETLVDETVLPEFQRLLKRAVRRRGCAYRQGGEEFLIILPNHTREEGVVFAERLRVETENTLFAASKLDARITVSVGVAAFPSDGRTFTEVVQAANASEHLAKDAGRNRVIACAGRCLTDLWPG